jgi:hypothetical protein
MHASGNDVTRSTAPKGGSSDAANASIWGDASVCESAPEFRSEQIPFPPEFAPSLPAGNEELLFHPDMFEPHGEGYWSYVFAIRFSGEGTPAANTKSLTEFLNRYYRGLITKVGESKGKKYDANAISAKLVATRHPNEFFGMVDLYDAFKTGKRLQLKVKVWLEGACLRAAASPRPLDAGIWNQLGSALDCLPCR